VDSTPRRNDHSVVRLTNSSRCVSRQSASRSSSMSGWPNRYSPPCPTQPSSENSAPETQRRDSPRVFEHAALEPNGRCGRNWQRCRCRCWFLPVNGTRNLLNWVVGSHPASGPTPPSKLSRRADTAHISKIQLLLLHSSANGAARSAQADRPEVLGHILGPDSST
jgi:hypothetical protein